MKRRRAFQSCGLVLALTALTLGLVAAGGSLVDAHKPITSKYSYNLEVFPIFRDRCGACHVAGGVAPMSLLTYQDAMPWAESIKEEVLNLRMPPRYAEPGFGAVRSGHGLTAKELDVVLDWAIGGAPEGDLTRRPETITRREGWPLGEPDLVLPMLDEYPLGPDTDGDTRVFVIPTGLTTDRFVGAVDVLPGSPAIVRAATVFVDTTGKARARDLADGILGFAEPADGLADEPYVLASWLPGETPASLPPGSGYRLPAKSDLVLRVRYKKTWLYTGTTIRDRSRVGLYFATGPAAAVRPLPVTGPANLSAADVPDGRLTFSHTLTEPVEIFAVAPDVPALVEAFRVDAVRPDRSSVPLLLLSRPQPEWRRRYWLEPTVSLPRGSRIDVTAVMARDAGAGVTTVPAGSQGDQAAPTRTRVVFDVRSAASRSR
jgi:hypothetical protein